MTKAKEVSEKGVQKSAILMMAVGEDAAAEVFKHLSPREVQQLGSAMAGLSAVTREEMAEVLAEFRGETEQYLALNVDSSSFIKSVLNKALGEERALSVIEDIQPVCWPWASISGETYRRASNSVPFLRFTRTWKPPTMVLPDNSSRSCECRLS